MAAKKSSVKTSNSGKPTVGQTKKAPSFPMRKGGKGRGK